MALNYAPENFKFFPHVKTFSLNDGVKTPERLTPSQIKVYGYIYSWFEAGFFCKVSIIAIAEYFSCSHSTVEVAVCRLEELGWIKVEHGKRPERSSKNKCNIYRIKRKPLALKAVKAEKKQPAKTKPKKNAAEVKNSTIYAITKMMSQIGINYDDKKWIEQRLRGS